MENDLLKLVAQVTVIGLVVWVVAKALGKAPDRNRHKNDPTQFSQASRVWIPSLVSAPNAEPFSQQPQTALY